MADEPILLNSITDVTPRMSGRVAVSGSHGGLYPAAVASQAGLTGVIFNDAGRGLEDAGVAGVAALGEVGVPAAAADCATCLIGSAEDMVAAGRVSFANAPAAALGVRTGDAVDAAARLMAAAASAPISARLPRPAEARQTTSCGGVAVILVDSASLVGPEDAGRIVVTGSHGGLIGGDPARALKADARLAVFNDAGFGKDRIGCSRLPALQARGVPAVTVSHMTARIGDAASALATGVISAANPLAEAAGLHVGERLAAAIEKL